MAYTTEMTNGLAIDANNLNNLKLAAKDNSPEAIKAAAKQFEAIFTNMMLKSMRDATQSEDPFASEQSKEFTTMLDQQLSNNLSGKGMGLAEILTRQLTKVGGAVTIGLAQAVSGDSAVDVTKTTTPLQQDFTPSILKSQPLKEKIKGIAPLTGDNAEFQKKMSGHAAEASKATGIPAHLMLGQAALESGWGKREIISKDGENSHNLFGIKATDDWKGKVVETMTTEYINGVKHKRVEKFRAYDSYTDSFKDYANLISTNPRYRVAMANLSSVTNYAQAIQNAGYATDPKYAAKLASVIHRVSA